MRILLFLTILSSCFAEIKHSFLAVDESRHQLHYVNQFKPEKNWTIKLPEKCRDIQLVGKYQVLLSAGKGFMTYDLKTKKIVSRVNDPQFKGTTCARRLPNGHTIVGCNQKGITFFELDKKNKVVKTANFPDLRNMRLMRLSTNKTLLFGSNDNEVIEANLDGKILSRTKIPNARHIYHIVRNRQKNMLIATGYGSSVVEIDSTGKEVSKIGEKAKEAGVGIHFFAGMQVLTNGNTVVSNWTGHGAQDSKKAPQILEFDKAGKLVWSWHDAEMSGTIHGLIVLDKCSPKYLHDDATGILAPVRRKK